MSRHGSTVTIRFTGRAFERVRKHLFKDDLEELCFLFCQVVESPTRLIFLANYVVTLDPTCYLRRTPTSIVIDPRATNAVYSRFMESPYTGLINIHSHPFENGAVRFSSTDDTNHLRELAWQSDQLPRDKQALGQNTQEHVLSMVFSQKTLDARGYSPGLSPTLPTIAQVQVLGETIYILTPTGGKPPPHLSARDRATYDIQLDLGRLSLYNYRENSATPISLLRKGVIKPKEGEPQHRVDTAKPQALKELEDSVEEKLKSSEDTSDVFNIPVSVAVSLAPDINKASQKGVSHEEIKQALQQKVQALQKQGDIFTHQPQQDKALQSPDLSGVPSWRGKDLDGNALDYIKSHYGRWLSTFGAEQNSVFQDQIRAHDPKLIQGVRNQLREEGKGRKVSDIVKTRSARVDRELENISVADLKKNPRLASTLYSRETRAAKAKAAAPTRSVTRK
jgi:hypothetical protein